MAILSHSPHVRHFVLDVVFSCLLWCDLKLKTSDWPLNINVVVLLFYTGTKLQKSGGRH